MAEQPVGVPVTTYFGYAGAVDLRGVRIVTEEGIALLVMHLGSSGFSQKLEIPSDDPGFFDGEQAQAARRYIEEQYGVRVSDSTIEGAGDLLSLTLAQAVERVLAAALRGSQA